MLLTTLFYGLATIFGVILLGLASSVLLGLLVLVAVSQWLLLYPIRLYWLFILFGLLVVLCTLGLLSVGNHLACWLTIAC